MLTQRNTRFFVISNTFITNNRLKLTKNQARAKQHPEAKLLLFENYLLSSSTLSSKSKKKCKIASVSVLMRQYH